MALVETLQRTASSVGEMYLRSNASVLFDLRGTFSGLFGIARVIPSGRRGISTFYPQLPHAE